MNKNKNKKKIQAKLIPTRVLLSTNDDGSSGTTKNQENRIRIHQHYITLIMGAIRWKKNETYYNPTWCFVEDTDFERGRIRKAQRVSNNSFKLLQQSEVLIVLLLQQLSILLQLELKLEQQPQPQPQLPHQHQLQLRWGWGWELVTVTVINIDDSYDHYSYYYYCGYRSFSFHHWYVILYTSLLYCHLNYYSNRNRTLVNIISILMWWNDNNINPHRSFPRQ